MSRKRPRKDRPLPPPTETQVRPGVVRREKVEDLGLFREHTVVDQFTVPHPDGQTFVEAYTPPNNAAIVRQALVQYERLAKVVLAQNSSPELPGRRITSKAAASRVIGELSAIRHCTSKAEELIAGARGANDAETLNKKLNELEGMMWEIARNADDTRKAFDVLAASSLPYQSDPSGRTLMELADAAIAAPVGRVSSRAWWFLLYRKEIDEACDEARARGTRLRYTELWSALAQLDATRRTAGQRRDQKLPDEPGMRRTLQSEADEGNIDIPGYTPRLRSNR